MSTEKSLPEWFEPPSRLVAKLARQLDQARLELEPILLLNEY